MLITASVSIGTGQSKLSVMIAVFSFTFVYVQPLYIANARPHELAYNECETVSTVSS